MRSAEAQEDWVTRCFSRAHREEFVLRDYRATCAFFGHPALEGFDGELCVGSPVSVDCFNTTTSALRTEAKDPQATFLVFDIIPAPNSSMGFEQRQRLLDERIKALPPQFKGRVVKLEQMRIESAQALQAFEERCLTLGFEGVMCRALHGVYKYGRSTVNEGWLLKLKRFTDAEAIVVGKEEEVEGNTQRPKGTLGALICRDCATGIEFNIGTGFTAAQRAAFWKQKLDGDGGFHYLECFHDFLLSVGKQNLGINA